MKRKDIENYNKEIEDLVPSEFTDSAWLQVVSPGYRKSKGTYSGKWCIIAPTKEIDKVWRKVFKLVQAEKAKAAKVRTGWGRLSFSDLMKLEGAEKDDLKNYVPKNSETERVICVYVADYRNKKAVFKLKDELRALGLKMDLKFKTDKATSEGIYSGDEREFLYIDKL